MGIFSIFLSIFIKKSHEFCKCYCKSHRTFESLILASFTAIIDLSTVFSCRSIRYSSNICSPYTPDCFFQALSASFSPHRIYIWLQDLSSRGVKNLFEPVCDTMFFSTVNDCDLHYKLLSDIQSSRVIQLTCPVRFSFISGTSTFSDLH